MTDKKILVFAAFSFSALFKMKISIYFAAHSVSATVVTVTVSSEASNVALQHA